MELDVFVKEFSELCEEADASLVTAETKFRAITEWSSIKAMSVIAMVDMNYNVQINGNDLRNCTTILDLFELVKSRK